MKATFLGTLQSPAPGAAIVGGIFGARSDGTIAFFVEMLGFIRGVIDHEAAIRNAGWTVATTLSAECPCGLARVACEYHAP